MSHAQNTTALELNVFLTGIHRLPITSKGRSLFLSADHFQGQLQTPQSLSLLRIIPRSIHPRLFPFTTHYRPILRCCKVFGY